MIIDRPVPFEEAVTLLRSRGLLPTTLRTAELDKLAAGIRRHSTYSATVTNSRYLQEIADVVRRIVDPVQQPGQYMGQARAREILRDFLQMIGYTAEQGTEGTLKDLASDARIDLVVKTNTEMAQGYGQFIQAQDPAVLDAFPCQELHRLQAVETPRQSNAGNQFSAGDGYGGFFWPNKWKGAGGRFYGGGRMIARKDDPIWSEISRFGNPYPPYDFNSGMWVKPVSRKEAIALGVIEAGTKIQQTGTDYAPPLQTGIKAISPQVLEALQRAIPGSTIKDGVLTAGE